MSVFGAGVAAGVAQTGLQSRQVAAQREKLANDASRHADRIRDVYEMHLLKVLEGEESNPSALSDRLRIDDQMDQREKPRRHAAGSNADPGTAVASPCTESIPAETDDDQPLYRHLDVKA